MPAPTIRFDGNKLVDVREVDLEMLAVHIRVVVADGQRHTSLAQHFENEDFEEASSRFAFRSRLHNAA